MLFIQSFLIFRSEFQLKKHVASDSSKIPIGIPVVRSILFSLFTVSNQTAQKLIIKCYLKFELINIRTFLE